MCICLVFSIDKNILLGVTPAPGRNGWGRGGQVLQEDVENEAAAPPDGLRDAQDPGLRGHAPPVTSRAGDAQQGIQHPAPALPAAAA